MLIGYRRPAGVTWSISGTGAGFVTSPTLDDGTPGRVTRIGWLSAGSPATSDYVALRALWPTAQPVRVLCLLGLVLVQGTGSPQTYSYAVPSGLKVTVFGRRAADPGWAYSLGGNSITQRSVVLPDGTAAIWFVLDQSLSDLIGLEFRIYNDDDNGSTWATAASFLDVGQAGVHAAAEVALQHGFQVVDVDPTERTRTRGAQLHSVALRSYRRGTFALVPAAESVARGGGLANAQDYESIGAALLRARPCAFVPYYKTAAGAFDGAALHRSAIFGAAAPGPLAHVAQSLRMFEHRYDVEELPPADPP